MEAALHSPLGHCIQVSKPNDECPLTQWEYNCPATPDLFWKSVKENIQDIVTYSQQLGMAQDFYYVDIKWLLEAVTKHFLWHSEYPFQENDLELRAYISKGLKKLTFPIYKKPHWVLQNWDNMMAFMMCGMHLDREIHTAGELWDVVHQRIGSYPQTPQNKAKGSGRASKFSTKITFTAESAIEQGTSSLQQQGDQNSSDQDIREDNNNQQRQRTAGNDLNNRGSDSSSDHRASSTS